MKRKIYTYLKNWKNSSNRKPLIVKGARQIGKTFIILEFGKNEYQNFVYCNLELEDNIRDIFNNGSLEPKRIIELISNAKNTAIFPNHTLLILDEVQACPIALTSLKYFNELAKEYHVIASGSLLGVALNRQSFSYPVGNVTTVTMKPMDFEEFIWAVKPNHGESLTKGIRECFNTNKPFALHDMCLELYKDYLFVGGMPRAILEYNSSHNMVLVSQEHQQIIDDYSSDMSKYNKTTEIPKTKIVFNNISTQLAKENKKFKYSLLKSGSRAKDFEQSVEWICTTGIANRLFRLEQIKLPLEAYKSLSDFKFFMNDIGLCCSFQKIKYETIKFDNWALSDFKGGLVENYVFNELRSNGFDLYYWTSGNTAEVDFITSIGDDIIPIEVKSNENVRSRSLSVYIQKYKPKYSIRISSRNFGFENNIKSIPLYAVFCLENGLCFNILT